MVRARLLLEAHHGAVAVQLRHAELEDRPDHGHRRRRSVLAVEGQQVRQVDVRDPVPVGRAEGPSLQPLLEPVDPPAGRRVEAGVDAVHLHAVGPVLGGHELLDQLPLVAGGHEEAPEALGRVDAHDVPEDRPLPHLHERLRDLLRALLEARAAPAAEYHHVFHALDYGSSLRSGVAPQSRQANRVAARDCALKGRRALRRRLAARGVAAAPSAAPPTRSCSRARTSPPCRASPPATWWRSLGRRLAAGGRAGRRAQAGGLRAGLQHDRHGLHARRSTPTRTPSRAPTRTRTWTPTTRSPSARGRRRPRGAGRRRQPLRRGRGLGREGQPHARTLGGKTKRRLGSTSSSAAATSARAPASSS